MALLSGTNLPRGIAADAVCFPVPVEDIAALSRSETRFEPALGAAERGPQISGWRNALRRVRST